MPDHFLVIGAQRSGTTYLYELLDEHPEIEMARPLRPEPKFFLDDARYAKGLDFYERTYFSGRPGAWLRGEKSTSYLESRLAAERVAATLPDAPLLVVVRDPVARAVSNYRFTVQHGFEDLPLAEALRAAASGERPYDSARFSVSPYDYLRRGRYVDHLETWAEVAGRDRLHVVLFEELVALPATIAGVYRHLGVDTAFRPAGLGTPRNVSDADTDVSDLDVATLAWLRDWFADSVRRLEEFLGRPLPGWR